MTSTAIARMIGATFGLVFVLVNAGTAGSPWSWLMRVAGVVVFVAVLARIRRLGEVTVEPRDNAIRVYWSCVLLEVAALLLGTRLLAANGHGEYGVALVAVVVGVHFLPLAWAFRQPAFHPLGVVLVALGVAGALVGLLGGGETGIALVAGVGSGLALLGYAAAPLAGRTAEQVPSNPLH